MPTRRRRPSREARRPSRSTRRGARAWRARCWTSRRSRRRPARTLRRSPRASAEPRVGVGKPDGGRCSGASMREACGGGLGGDAGLVPHRCDDDAHAVDVARLRVVAGGEVGDHLGVLERRHDRHRGARLGAVRGRRHVVREHDGLGLRPRGSAVLCAAGSSALARAETMSVPTVPIAATRVTMLATLIQITKRRWRARRRRRRSSMAEGCGGAHRMPSIEGTHGGAGRRGREWSSVGSGMSRVLRWGGT